MDQQVSIFIAFGAGVLSFFSACVLPLIPAYISFISGLTFEEITSEKAELVKSGKIIISILLFITGFTLIFTLYGATASLAGQVLLDYRNILNKVAGIFIIFFGLHLTGLFKIGFLNFEKRMDISRKSSITYLTAFLVGIGFAIGWTPCVGPILGSILLIASTTKSVSQGAYLLVSYSLGLGIPFLIVGIMVNRFLSFFKIIKKYMKTIEVISGLILIMIGLLIFLNKLTLIGNLLFRAL